jgi:protein SCO1/2
MTNGLLASQKRGVFITVAAVVAVIASLLALFIYGLNRPVLLSDSELKSKGTFLFENPRAFESFALIDDNKQPFTPAKLQGKWSLVFFGFTYCPDVCPTTLALLNQFYQEQQSGDYYQDLQIILASVDPGRDTPDKLHQYVQFFNKDFTGVTGEFLDLHRFATQLNVPFSKVPGGGENYTVEHGGNIAIINPRGHYVGFFRAPLTLGQLNVGYQSLRASRD